MSMDFGGNGCCLEKSGKEQRIPSLVKPKSSTKNNTRTKHKNMNALLEQQQRPLPQDQKPLGTLPDAGGIGPKAIQVDRPDTKSILKKLKSIDRDGSKK